MKDRAYAKINLSLNITGVREDGYHTLESVFLPIDFFDELEIVKDKEMSYSCNNRFIRFNEANTIVKAINLMKETYDIKDNFKVTLSKHIPMQAGLAGGSTDASSVIRILNKMYNLNLTDEEARKLCYRIGADVTFTYFSKPAYVSGVGENIEPIEVKNQYYCLIAKPSRGVSTKICYETMNLETCPHPDIEKLVEALKNGDDVIPYLGNSMEPAAISLVSEIAELKNRIIELGGDFALMSGSGSSVFTLSRNRDLVKALSDTLRGEGYFTRYTKIRK